MYTDNRLKTASLPQIDQQSLRPLNILSGLLWQMQVEPTGPTLTPRPQAMQRSTRGGGTKPGCAPTPLLKCLFPGASLRSVLRTGKRSNRIPLRRSAFRRTSSFFHQLSLEDDRYWKCLQTAATVWLNLFRITLGEKNGQRRRLQDHITQVPKNTLTAILFHHNFLEIPESHLIK